jgi:hypothetical protein
MAYYFLAKIFMQHHTMSYVTSDSDSDHDVHVTVMMFVQVLRRRMFGLGQGHTVTTR